jgi:hypothetical protein
MKINIGFFTTTILGVLFFSGTNAQLSFNLSDTIQIEEVIVTGTPTKVNRNNVPYVGISR